jgi:hypothetical protein
MRFLRTRRGGANRLPSDQTEAILRKHLDTDFRVFPMAETTTSPAQIDAIGETFNVQYPAELATHICGRFHGIYIEVKEDIWPRPKAFDVGPFWSFLYAIHTFTSAPESPDWMRLDVAARWFQQRTDLIAAPVLRIVGDADLFCVDAEARLVRHNHEANELELVDGNFWNLFEQEIAALYSRKVRMKGDTRATAPGVA